jgi:hypothetical protein
MNFVQPPDGSHKTPWRLAVRYIFVINTKAKVNTAIAELC